jgi:4'-phosphopantetheinyl transferase
VARIFLARFDLSAAHALAPAELSALAASLDPDEQLRAGRFVRDGDRARFIVAHAGLRRCLGGALGCRPAAVRLRAAPGGKPELALETPGGASLSFNLAHSATVALVAWGDAPLGVDIEDIDVTAQRADFYAAWTRKEALLKALGTGLARDATVIDLVAQGEAGEGRWSWEDPLTGVSWTVRDLDLGAAHKAALATVGSPLEIVLTDVR